ncbi:DUF3883 domain-containing protein [Geomonas subterranea]|uniref:DUF3883 domain-containing protein n=1 Tax=Geomonas subterranea TaxID=2847989 RepID=A0ABX8LL80_9BACT|nr:MULTISPECIES: DUF3883 domain-containing protein [Geomonas]QXE92793.1 DUF3883 domain-containing protein [Geomonas subterranea]QXM09104.1 DUF3883 domain-containing protein [Geomonas subterranea]
MPRFMAIKIHYDHRKSLPPYLKYSKLPTHEEYEEYLKLFQKSGIGGEGFHECLNFRIREGEDVEIYLPPTSLPAASKIEDEFVIFSFTYKEDMEMPDHVIGVHANVHFEDLDGVERDDVDRLDGIEWFIYHATAPEEYVTLFTPPLPYVRDAGIYTPEFERWGYGLRYINEEHAKNIIRAAMDAAAKRIEAASDTERLAIEREITVLRTIAVRYFPLLLEEGAGEGGGKDRRTAQTGGAVPPPPDRELGLLGERLVYEREIDYVKKLGLEPACVEWISQAVPTSPYDIKTVRPSKKGYSDHFLEVKSSRMDTGCNVYISSNQIEYFERHPDASTFIFVNFDSYNKPRMPFVELTLEQLRQSYELIPLKFKLRSLSKGDDDSEK